MLANPKYPCYSNNHITTESDNLFVYYHTVWYDETN